MNDIIGDDIQEIEDLKKHLRLNIRSKNIYSDLLNETGKLSCKPAKTPVELNWKRKDCDKDTPLDKGRYQKLIRKLIYLSLLDQILLSLQV